MKTYWISFAKNKNLGCCIIDAEDQTSALNKTYSLGINPGGEAMFFDLDLNDETALAEIEKWGKNKLITPEDLMNNGYKRLTDISQEQQGMIENHSGTSIICEEHNKEIE